MISATIQKAAETISRLDALRKKMAVSAYLKKKRTAQHNRARIKERQAAELLIERALRPFFVDQIESAAKALAATVAPEGTKVFCPTGPGGGVDATCGRGGSGFKNISTGKVTIGGVYWYDEDGEEVDLPREQLNAKIRSKWQALTGRKSTLQDIAKAVGIPDGCTIAIMGREDFGGIEVRGDSEELGIAEIRRTVSEEYGGAAIYNDELTVSKRYREKGLGTKILASQVENASTYGFTKIVTGASKAPDTNGYYTWARLGYDGPFKKETQEALPPSLKGAERVSDLMKTKEGREWWKDNGTGFFASFSLEKGSQSRKVLDEYVEAKFGSKSEGGKSSGDDRGGRSDPGQDLGQPQSTKSTQQALPHIFNPKDWNQKLVDTLYPAMVKIAVVGMDGEMRRMGLQIKRGFAETKSSATDLLDGLDDSGGLLDFEVLDTPYGPVNMAFLFEYPDWMKQAIVEFLKESFSQPYWDELNKTTLGDIEKYLQEGIKEGWSIEKMAAEMAPQLLEEGRYAQIRGRNIARTEAGHALNGARSMGIDSVIAELQGTGLDIRKLWNSVRGTTTRPDHWAIHGVPADKDGTWLLGGVRCRWPGDVVLPANQRCNCQCTLETSFGMTNEEAQELIQMHEGKMASAVWSELRTKVFSIKCGGEGGTPGPCSLNKPEVKPARKPRKPKVEKPVESDSDEKPKAKPEKAGEFKKFKNGKEAEEILAKSAKQWMDGPADDYFANKGVKAYAGTSESFRINDCLRQKCGDKGLDSKAADLKKVIDKAAFPESIESHRSINPSTPESRAEILAFFEKRVGQTFVDSAFVSTTANKAYAKTWAKGAKAEPISVTVHVKGGSKAIYVPKDITGRQEWEVLIQSGSKFRVKSVEGSSVVMELENE